MVTGDHGNHIGEHASPIPIKECGHPRGMYDEPVIRIPWLEINTGNRRQITSELTNKSSREIQNNVVTERSQSL
ncbi:hypothetical protein [Haloquadratum walsbyi]|uniref:hypothetical protein n=1 Tax=Haloquadratum walsbyi TaxID=293091 RepID=UPI000B1FD65D|nr:hypothetical protein [Haloquadratum walsbyi]